MQINELLEGIVEARQKKRFTRGKS